MVSQKVIIVLVMLAILLSAFSIAITLSTSNAKVPEIKFVPGETIPDADKGQVSITIDKPNSTP
jgi:hypothetical protein